MKFKYGDKIKVIDGFFDGMYGIVLNVDEEGNKYYVEISKTVDQELRTREEWILSRNLVKSGI